MIDVLGEPYGQSDSPSVAKIRYGADRCDQSGTVTELVGYCRALAAATRPRRTAVSRNGYRFGLFVV